MIVESNLIEGNSVPLSKAEVNKILDDGFIIKSITVNENYNDDGTIRLVYKAPDGRYRLCIARGDKHEADIMHHIRNKTPNANSFGAILGGYYDTLAMENPHGFNLKITNTMLDANGNDVSHKIIESKAKRINDDLRL